MKGEVAGREARRRLRSEVGGVDFKKKEVVSEANRRGFIENKLCLLYNQAVKNFFRKEIF